ncbi:unnamed protein product [Pleuronectes platessa]|uniref:Secreted protein n=1 Tax=Pleuronectes platessa TaxID=8262 RepID=A0A9N7U7I2_PLEPL|nr:unnamed protein product [Pleuronectes platessa]
MNVMNKVIKLVTALLTLDQTATVRLSRVDDVYRRGGAGLPRRSLCSADPVAPPARGSTFKPVLSPRTRDTAGPQHRRCRRGSSSRQRSRGQWSCEAGKRSALRGLVSQLTDASSSSSLLRVFPMLLACLYMVAV